MKRLLAVCALGCALLIGNAAGAQTRPGVFDTDQDVGETAIKGSTAYDAKGGSYTVTSSGANIWADKDAFHYVWTRR